MRRKHLPLIRRGIGAEGHAEKVAAQGHEHGGIELEALALPRADIIGLDRLAAIAGERDRAHLRAELGDGQPDGAVFDHPAGL